MTPRLPSSLLLALAVLMAPPAVWAARQPGTEEATAIVFKLRASAGDTDPKRTVAARLAAASRGTARWQPENLRPLFARRTQPPAIGKGESSRELDGVYVSDVPRGIRVDEAVALLAGDPGVEYAQPDYVRETHAFSVNDPFYHSSGTWGQSYGDLWALAKLDVGHAWNLSRGDDVVVAVVDSGVDYLHPELSSQMWLNPDELGQAPDNGYPGDLRGWDFVSNDDDPQDEFGHGTHMAGIIAAQANNGIGIAGVALGARLMAVRAIAGGGTGNSSTLAAGIVYAADNGAHVITVSSGCIVRCPSDPLIESAVRHATELGAIVVVSAGNRGDDLTFYSPQNMTDPRPIVVASTDQFDRRESFGNHGAWVDLVAPGGGTNPEPPVIQPVTNILSLAARFCSPLVCNSQFLVGSEYLRRAGTSMSAAYVSGVAALILSANPVADLDVVRAQLFGNAADLGPRGHEAMFGWGRVTGLDTVADLRRYILARVLAPANGQVVGGLVRIAGAADARTISHYEVSVGPGASPATWQTTGISPVGRATPQGDLALWDTQGLAAGTWTIRLVVHDTVGGRREHRRTVTVQGSPLAFQLVLDVASEHGGSGSVQVDPPGAACDGRARMTQTCSYPISPGTTVTLTPAPADLSAFAGWSGACSGSGPCTVAITALHGVRATFRGPARLGLRVEQRGSGSEAIFVDPPGGSCSSRCSFPYPPGSTVVSLDGGQPGPLNTVSIFGETCEGGSFCTVVMDRDRSVRAEVTSVDISQPIVVSVSRDQRVPLGTEVTLEGFASAPFDPGAQFHYSWVDEITGEFLGDTPSIAVTPAFGYHELRFTASGDDLGSASAVVRVIVHDP